MKTKQRFKKFTSYSIFIIWLFHFCAGIYFINVVIHELSHMEDYKRYLNNQTCNTIEIYYLPTYYAGKYKLSGENLTEQDYSTIRWIKTWTEKKSYIIDYIHFILIMTTILLTYVWFYNLRIKNDSARSLSSPPLDYDNQKTLS